MAVDTDCHNVRISAEGAPAEGAPADCSSGADAETLEAGAAAALASQGDAVPSLVL